jgi:hypothetical protein
MLIFFYPEAVFLSVFYSFILGNFFLRFVFHFRNLLCYVLYFELVILFSIEPLSDLSDVGFSTVQ